MLLPLLASLQTATFILFLSQYDISRHCLRRLHIEFPLSSSHRGNNSACAKKTASFQTRLLTMVQMFDKIRASRIFQTLMRVLQFLSSTM